jgi:hypothetical protein
LSNGFANRCETTKWVWVTKHLAWNPPDNPNQRKAAAKVALQVPDDCAWKRDFMRASAEVLALPLEPLGNPSGTVAEPFRNQKQEQEQKQEQKKRSRKPSVKTSIPEDFAVSDRVKAWAADKGYDRLDQHLEAFRSKAKAKGYVYADWDEGFMGAIREDWAGLRAGSQQHNGARRNVQHSILHADDNFAELTP